MNCRGKIAMVTGASSGLGRGIALELGRLGATVLLVGRDEQRLAGVSEAIVSGGGNAVHYLCDIVAEVKVRELARQVRAEHGGLQILVNCAGRELLTPTQVLSIPAVRDMFDINVIAMISVTRHFLSLLRRDAVIVNVGSAASRRGEAGLAAYSASKAAVSAFSRCLAVELAPSGIRVNVVSPGMVQSEMASRMMAKLTETQAAVVASRHRLGLGEIADVAHAVAFLASEEAKWITGHELVVDGGLTV